MKCLNSDTLPLCTQLPEISASFHVPRSMEMLPRLGDGERKVNAKSLSFESSLWQWRNGPRRVPMTGHVTAPFPFYRTCRAGSLDSTLTWSLRLCSFSSMSATVEHAETNRVL
jgi:hypothetical protein